jgi:hypothetical protein
MNHRSLAALSALALAACSGASAQLVEAPRDDVSAGASSGTSSGGGNGATGSTSSGSGSGGAPGQGTSSGATTGSSGSGGSQGTDFDAGVAPNACPAGGTEQTPASGESAADPTEFDTVACGALPAGDSYFWTFTLPPSATKFGLAFTGGIRIELTLNGNTMNVVPGASLPFRTKEPYLLRITPAGNLAQSYVLVVTEK